MAAAAAISVQPDASGVGGTFTVANAAGGGFTAHTVRTTSANQTAVFTSHDKQCRDKTGAVYVPPLVTN